jgi:DNA (cytosine-5)-methyltransferase 1
MTIASLDLFSGIGGFALTLKSVATPVAYCEIDEYCRTVLKSNIIDGRLPDAPIYNDVRTLPMDEVSQKSPRLVTAGFPCQDISNARTNPMGLRGSRSSLYFWIIEIIDRIPTIDMVLLENVPNIVRLGLTQIVTDFTDRGFCLRWVVCAASESGALHRRLRWFMMAYRSPENLRSFARCDAIDVTGFNTIEPVPRIMHVNDLDVARNVHANRALGNAVVPQQVLGALTLLANSWDSVNRTHVDINDVTSSHRFVYECGLDRKVVRFMRDPKNRHVNLQLDVRPNNDVRILRKLWPTPISSIQNQYSNPDRRRITILSNVIFYERSTYEQVVELCHRKSIEIPERNRIHRNFRINCQFVCWLMGYPIDWFDRLITSNTSTG